MTTKKSCGRCTFPLTPENGVILACRHSFHSSCILEWIGNVNGSLCPVCKVSFTYILELETTFNDVCLSNVLISNAASSRAFLIKSGLPKMCCNEKIDPANFWAITSDSNGISVSHCCHFKESCVKKVLLDKRPLRQITLFKEHKFITFFSGHNSGLLLADRMIYVYNIMKFHSCHRDDVDVVSFFINNKDLFKELCGHLKGYLPTLFSVSKKLTTHYAKEFGEQLSFIKVPTWFEFAKYGLIRNGQIDKIEQVVKKRKIEITTQFESIEIDTIEDPDVTFPNSLKELYIKDLDFYIYEKIKFPKTIEVLAISRLYQRDYNTYPYGFSGGNYLCKDKVVKFDQFENLKKIHIVFEFDCKYSFILPGNIKKYDFKKETLLIE